MRAAKLAIPILAAVRLAMPEGAHAADLSACDLLKLKATGRKAAAKLRCRAVATLAGSADPRCEAAAERRFDDAFAAAEAKGSCTVVGDAPATEASVDQFVNDFAAALGAPASGAPAACKACKLKAARLLTFCRIRQLARHLDEDRISGLPCDSAFVVRWARCERRAAGACPTNADAAAAIGAVSSFTATAPAKLPPCNGAGRDGHRDGVWLRHDVLSQRRQRGPRLHPRDVQHGLLRAVTDVPGVDADVRPEQRAVHQGADGRRHAERPPLQPERRVV